MENVALKVQTVYSKNHGNPLVYSISTKKHKKF